MNVGDLVPMKSAKAEFSNDIAHGTLTYKPEKGKRFVFMFLGTEDISGNELEAFKVLDELGWQRKNHE